jgi:hypothetical protein
MRVRQLSSTGDFVFGQSQQNFLVDSPAAVAQVVKTNLRLWLGEWYLNLNDGTPYPEGVLGYHSQATADATIQNQILSIEVIVSSTNVPAGSVPGQLIPAVTDIASYTSSINTGTRAYSAETTLNTVYGPTPLQLNDLGDF